MTTTEQCIPLGDDVFTEGALASMVGKTVPLTYGYDGRKRLGNTTVLAARQDSGSLILTLDFDERTTEAVVDAIGSTPNDVTLYNGPRGPEKVARHYGIGFTVGSARYEAPDHVKRIIAGMNLREVAIVNTPPIQFPSEDA